MEKQDHRDDKAQGDGKIQIGRLAVDPVFLALFTFSVFSALAMGLLIWSSVK